MLLVGLRLERGVGLSVLFWVCSKVGVGIMYVFWGYLRGFR